MIYGNGDDKNASSSSTADRPHLSHSFLNFLHFYFHFPKAKKRRGISTSPFSYLCDSIDNISLNKYHAIGAIHIVAPTPTHAITNSNKLILSITMLKLLLVLLHQLLQEQVKLYLKHSLNLRQSCQQIYFINASK